MLTKENAAELYQTIGCFHLVNPCCSPCVQHEKLINKIQDKIKELTEKPQREIHVGDIYKNGYGNLVQICGLEGRPEGYMYNCDRGWVYDKFGIRMLCTTDESYNLDLSKCYKLVEIEDVD